MCGSGEGVPPAAAAAQGGAGAGGARGDERVADDEVLLLVGVRRFEIEVGRAAQRMQVGDRLHMFTMVWGISKHSGITLRNACTWAPAYRTH